MNTIINYFLEANLLMVVMYCLYLLAFRNENQFSFRRGYLHVTLLASVLAPLIKFPQSSVIPSLSNTQLATMLPDLVIGDRAAQSASEKLPYLSIGAWIALAYALVVVMLLALLIIRFIRLSNFFAGLPGRRDGAVLIVETDEPVPVFSFFNRIVIGSASSFSEKDKQQIIAHERVHAAKLHSLDIMISNVTHSLFWFNPVTWLISREFHELHEYEADRVVAEQSDRHDYTNLLARMVLISNGYALASHFNKSITIKRIQMMNTLKRKIAGWKLAVTIPLALAAGVMVACQDQLKEMVSDSSMVIQEVEIPAAVQQQLIRFQQENPGAKIILLEQTADWKEKLKQLNDQYGNGQLLGGFNYTSENELRYFVFFKWDEKMSQLAEQTAIDGEVFTIVEDPARPVNGMTAFYEAISKQLQLNEQVKSNTLEGRVFVEFVVNEDGSLSNFNLLKGIDPVMDKLALAAVAQSTETWLPAKQRGKKVKQRMVLPITFRNDGSGTTGQLKTDNKRFYVESSIQLIDGQRYAMGQVTDQETGAPLTGAAIVVAGRTEGIVVDRDGRFKLKLPTKSGELVVSYIGYETTTVSY